MSNKKRPDAEIALHNAHLLVQESLPNFGAITVLPEPAHNYGDGLFAFSLRDPNNKDQSAVLLIHVPAMVIPKEGWNFAHVALHTLREHRWLPWEDAKYEVSLHFTGGINDEQ